MRSLAKSYIAIAIVLSSAGAGALAASAYVGERREPPTPPWVGSKGPVNLAELPAWIPVAGPDGEALKDSTGRVFVIATQAYEFHGAPPVPYGMVAADSGVDLSQLDRPTAPEKSDEKVPELLLDSDGRPIPPTPEVHDEIVVFWQSVPD